MEFTLLFAAATAVAAMWLSNRITRPDVERPTDLLIGAAAGGLFVGRLAAMILDGANPFSADILIIRAGVDTGFATVGALAVLAWAARFDLPRVSDALAPAALAGLAGWHGGCVWRGTCLGAVSDLPWAFAQSGSAVTRHPVELYTALLLLVSAYLVHRLPARPWLRTSTGLALAALVRLVTQPLRPSLTGGPVGWYVTGLAAGMLVAVWALWRRPPAQPSPG